MFAQISLRFRTEQWPISTLLKTYLERRINLSPYYQRNEIWSLTAQRRLVDTVHRGYPMPNFFIRVLQSGAYEMVDGQQRARTLIGYWNGDFSDDAELKLSESIKANPKLKPIVDSFKQYPLSMCMLDPSVSDRDVEEFYVLVNSTGLRLNRPELRKAAYYDTRFLSLCTGVANNRLFEDLRIFTEKSVDRMNDIDFVSELVTFLKYGFTDKKEMVDALYETDISASDSKELKARAVATLEKINALNAIVPIADTRFKQKADFYTLFAFVSSHPSMPQSALDHAYRILLKLSPHIRPSQEECEPLFTYAINCVSQSHLKKAREARNSLFESLFLNAANSPNDAQSAIAKYFGFGKDGFVKQDTFLMFRLEALRK